MPYCEKCGAKNDENAKFCEACGTPIEITQEVVTPKQEPLTTCDYGAYGAVGKPNAPRAKRRQLTKKNKLLIGAIAFVAVAAVVAFLIIGSLFSPEKTVREFMRAMEQSDYEAIAELAEMRGSSDKLTAQQLEPMCKLFNERGVLYGTIGEALEQDIALLKRGKIVPLNAAANIIAHGSILFETYSIELASIDLQVTSNIDNTVFKCEAGEAMAKTAYEPTKIEGILPGIYDVTSTFKNDIGELSASTTVRAESDFSVYENVFEYGSCYIEKTRQECTAFYINGKKVMPAMQDEYGYGLFPLSGDVEVKVECVAPWGGTMEYSQELSAQDCRYGGTIYPKFVPNEDTQKELLQMSVAQLKSNIDLLNAHDFSAAAAVPDLYDDALFDFVYEKLENEANSADSYYWGKCDITVKSVAGEIHNIDISDNDTEISVIVQITSDTVERYFNSDGTPYALWGGENQYVIESLDHDDVFEVNLRYNNGWKIAGIYNSYYTCESPISLEWK